MEGPDMARAIVGKKLQSPATIVVYGYLEDQENVNALLDTLCTYIRKLSVVQGDNVTVREMADELLGEVVVEALTHSERYDPSRKLRLWLNGIALNVVRRKRDERIKNYQREPSVSDIQHIRDALSDDAFFEQFAALAASDPEQEAEATEQFEAMLSLIPENDRQLLRLYILRDFDAKRLAAELGISQPAARQRISRALKQLRTIFEKQGGEHNE